MNSNLNNNKNILDSVSWLDHQASQSDCFDIDLHSDRVYILDLCTILS